MYYNVTLRRIRCNLCFSGRAISITYCEDVFVALGVQHAMRVSNIVFCGVLGSTVFFQIVP